MGQLQGIDLTPEIEGRYYSPKMQWICIHVHFTEDDSGKEWDLYYWPAFGSRDESYILALYPGDRVINLGEFHLPVGTFQFSDEGANIRFKNNSLSGTFPRYDLYVEGSDEDGERYAVSLDLVAESKAFEAVKDLRGIDWHYIPRLRATGSIRTSEGTRAVSGSGYLERRRGRFWAPGIKMGLWESLPMQATDQVGVPLFYKVWKNDESAQLQTFTFTTDGQTLHDLQNVEVKILETARLDARIEHPLKYEISAQGEDGSATAVVTRSPHRMALRNFFAEPDAESHAVGIYGPGRIEATVNHRGETFETSGPTFGSALYFWTE